MKRILYISYDGMTDALGEGQVINYLIGLRAYNYEFDILSFEKPEKFATQKNHIDALLKTHEIGWFPQVFHSEPPIISKVYDKIRLSGQAIKLYKKHKYDLIHCRGYMGAEVGLFLKEKFGVKFLFDMRGFWADEKADGGSWNTKKWFWRKVFEYYKKKEKAFVSQASHIISLTHSGKSEITKWPFYKSSIPISVIPCCADQNHFKITSILKKRESRKHLGIDDGAIVLSYLGSLGAWYMIDEMLQFFKELLTQHSNAKFLIVTNSNHDIVLQKLTNFNLSTKDFIIVTVPFSKVPEYIYACDISISFIREVYSKISSSPVKIGEILSMGIPIISNSIGDINKLFLEENVGILIKDFNSKTFSSAVKAIDECISIDPKSIRQVADKYYSLEKGIEKYATVYREIFKR